MQRSFISAVVAFVLLTSSVASPQAPARARQSVLAGQTIGDGNTMFHGQVGWPGLSFTGLLGVTPRVDFGGKFSLLYGYEGITRVGTTLGTKLQGVLRLTLLERGKLNLGVRFSPGVFFYGLNGRSQPGLTLPVDFMLGFAISPQLMVHVGLDFPMFVAFGDYPGVVFPVLAGGGLEYFLDQNLGVTFNVRAGPSAVVTDDYPYYYTCYDGRDRPYRCGRRGALAAAEFLVGISYKF